MINQVEGNILFLHQQNAIALMLVADGQRVLQQAQGIVDMFFILNATGIGTMTVVTA